MRWLLNSFQLVLDLHPQKWFQSTAAGQAAVPSTEVRNVCRTQLFAFENDDPGFTTPTRSHFDFTRSFSFTRNLTSVTCREQRVTQANFFGRWYESELHARQPLEREAFHRNEVEDDLERQSRDTGNAPQGTRSSAEDKLSQNHQTECLWTTRP